MADKRVGEEFASGLLRNSAPLFGLSVELASYSYLFCTRLSGLEMTDNARLCLDIDQRSLDGYETLSSQDRRRRSDRTPTDQPSLTLKAPKRYIVRHFARLPFPLSCTSFLNDQTPTQRTHSPTRCRPTWRTGSSRPRSRMVIRKSCWTRWSAVWAPGRSLADGRYRNSRWVGLYVLSGCVRGWKHCPST